MIDEKAIKNIRANGVFMNSAEDRNKVLFDDLGLRGDQKAAHVIVAGCVQPTAMPQAFEALKNFMERYQVDYTFLSKEYCCGWIPLGQPAVMAKNDEDIARAKEISREFVQENFQQAKDLGARSIVLFCAACEPTYSNYKDLTDLEVISYTELLSRYFQGGRLQSEADYYAGCYRFRRRITSEPLDVEPALKVLDKIEGLKINYLDNNNCCYIPPLLEKLTDEITTETVVTICTGCYYNLKRTLTGKGDYRVMMLPELVWEAVKDK